MTGQMVCPRPGHSHRGPSRLRRWSRLARTPPILLGLRLERLEREQPMPAPASDAAGPMDPQHPPRRLPRSRRSGPAGTMAFVVYTDRPASLGAGVDGETDAGRPREARPDPPG